MNLSDCQNLPHVWRKSFPCCYLRPLLLVLFPQTLKTVHFCSKCIVTSVSSPLDEINLDFLCIFLEISTFSKLLLLPFMFVSFWLLFASRCSLLAQVSGGVVLQAPHNKHSCPPQHKVWVFLCCNITMALTGLVCDQLRSQATKWLFS